MILFEVRKKFSSTTGEEIGSSNFPTNHVCDFCGAVIPEQGEDFDDASEDICYRVFENSEAEPMFHGMQTVNGEDGNLCPYELFNNHPEFHYCRKWGDLYGGCEIEMLKKYSGQLFERMYKARINMLREKIADGTFKLENFGLEYS